MLIQSRTLFSILMLLIALWPAITLAQVSELGYFIFTVSCTDGENRITFGGTDEGGYTEVVGFDIYRSRSGTCTTATRLTDTPIPRTLNEDFSHNIVDADIVDGTLYRYQIYGVNANRTTLTSPHVIYPMFGSTDQYYSGCNAPAGKGTVIDRGWTVAIQPCPGTCQPGFFLETGSELLRPYIGQVLLVYGGFGWSIEGFGLNLESFEFANCVVAVEESNWSNIKLLFQ